MSNPTAAEKGRTQADEDFKKLKETIESNKYSVMYVLGYAKRMILLWDCLSYDMERKTKW